MSRSVQRSKCRRGGCLLCCPWKATGERPVSEQRSTQDSVSTLVAEVEPPEPFNPWDYPDLDWDT